MSEALDLWQRWMDENPDDPSVVEFRAILNELRKATDEFHIGHYPSCRCERS